MTQVLGQENTHRYYGLDILRGLAILCVVLFHFTYKIYDLYPKALPILLHIPYGEFPVYVFFSLSGFVILMSFKRYSWSDFLIIRFIRLYPIFLIGCITTYCTLYFLPFIDNPIDFTGFLVNLTMVSTWFHYPYLDGSYWTLSYEIGFYGFVVICIVVGKDKIFHYIPLLLTITSAIFIFFAYYIPSPLHYFLMATKYSHLFALGVTLYMMQITGAWYHKRYVIPIIGIYCIEYYYHGFTGIGVILVIMILLLIGAHLRITYNSLTKPLIELGNISYCLYIFHQMIGITMIAYLESCGMNAYISILITLIILIYISYCLTYYYDAPIGKFLKKIMIRS